MIRLQEPAGFLVEAFNHLSRQVKTVEDRRTLQESSLAGCEPKPLPYLLCQMNLLLHGLDAPRIDPNNALRFKLSEIGEKDRVDVILVLPLSAAMGRGPTYVTRVGCDFEVDSESATVSTTDDSSAVVA